MRPIYVTNESKLVTNHDAEQMVQAVNYQLTHHVAPAWMRTPVHVYFTTNVQSAHKGSYVIGIFDDSDQADALGWHTEDEEGRVYGRVFAKPVLDNGGDALHKDLSVASVLSHEVIEAFLDPNCNRYAEADDGTLWAVEGCDAVENFSYGVSETGKTITVSDFVTPSFFDTTPPEGVIFDYLAKLSKPFTIAEGGYSILMKDGKVSQKFGKNYPAFKKKTKQSEFARTYRRKHQ